MPTTTTNKAAARATKTGIMGSMHQATAALNQARPCHPFREVSEQGLGHRTDFRRRCRCTVSVADHGIKKKKNASTVTNTQKGGA